jgi:hypothetical protein
MPRAWVFAGCIDGKLPVSGVFPGWSGAGDCGKDSIVPPIIQAKSRKSTFFLKMAEAKGTIFF